MLLKTTSAVVTLALGAALVAGVLSGCTTIINAPPQTPGVLGETPVAPEKNPPGDIPDSQVFVQYRSDLGGYQLDVPEGWARTTQGLNVSFTDKLDGLKVVVTQSATAPTAASAQTNQIAALSKTGRAVQVNKVQEVQLAGGSSVLIEYSSNSDPDPVTGKQVRLENDLYLYFHNGKLASLTLWAPLGADNVDQWQRIAQSFGWS